MMRSLSLSLYLSAPPPCPAQLFENHTQFNLVWVPCFLTSHSNDYVWNVKKYGANAGESSLIETSVSIICVCAVYPQLQKC